jgi:hypothetical protein
MTDTTQSVESGAAWYVVPVGVSTFTANFTLQFTSASANGMTFCIQNQPTTPSPGVRSWVSGGILALAGSQTGLGYATPGGGGSDIAGLLSSVAIAFDLFTVPNSVGLYTNGALPTGSQVATGLNFASGHPLNVTLVYNGTTLAMTMQDTVTLASFSHNFTIDIPGTVGGPTAYVGFTGGTGGGMANQLVTAWTHATP